MKKKNIKIIYLVFFLILGFIYYHANITEQPNFTNKSYALENIPEYSGDDFIIINNNEPTFTEEEKITETFEIYEKLDKLGRTTEAYANIGIDSMPTEERTSIGNIKPSGWHTIKYDNINGKYLYNRCHLIGYQLTGENANENNLITCTRQMNIGPMLDFENKVANYIKETKNHVLYRATPIYENSNLLASGLHLEALSVEDDGAKIKFNVYIYNVQDGIKINYQNGESQLESR